MSAGEPTKKTCNEKTCNLVPEFRSCLSWRPDRWRNKCPTTTRFPIWLIFTKPESLLLSRQHVCTYYNVCAQIKCIWWFVNMYMYIYIYIYPYSEATIKRFAYMRVWGIRHFHLCVDPNCWSYSRCLESTEARRIHWDVWITNAPKLPNSTLVMVAGAQEWSSDKSNTGKNDLFHLGNHVFWQEIRYNKPGTLINV